MPSNDEHGYPVHNHDVAGFHDEHGLSDHLNARIQLDGSDDCRATTNVPRHDVVNVIVARHHGDAPGLFARDDRGARDNGYILDADIYCRADQWTIIRKPDDVFQHLDH